METELKKKYGLATAIALVVGIVIGSGVFFKAEKILVATGGNLPLGILAWAIGGAIMVSCAYTFSLMATKYEYVNGVVDYAEVTIGKKYGYFMGWFTSIIFYPALTSVLAWVSARYTSVLFGFSQTGGECMVIACFYMIAIYALNSLSPVLAGKFQVSTTVIKLIPLILMAVIGTIRGFSSGLLIENFTSVAVSDMSGSKALFTAVVATAFAYEGWAIATSINAELKDAKKNLPRALVFGTLTVAIVYILYYVGLAGAVENSIVMESGEKGARVAFEAVFSKIGGTGLFVFVVISCLGTLNGLMLASTRGLYSLAARGEGPRSDIFNRIDPVTNMPVNSSVFGLFICGAWLLYFYGANLTDSWFGPFSFDSSELPIVTVYFMYIPIFFKFMQISDDTNPFRKFIAPVLSIIGCIFMVVAAFVAHGKAVFFYLIVFAVIMIIGMAVNKKR